MPNKATIVGTTTGFVNSPFIQFSLLATGIVAGFGLGWELSFFFATHNPHSGANTVVRNCVVVFATLSQSLFVIYLPLRVWREKMYHKNS